MSRRTLRLIDTGISEGDGYCCGTRKVDTGLSRFVLSLDFGRVSIRRRRIELVYAFPTWDGVKSGHGVDSVLDWFGGLWSGRRGRWRVGVEVLAEGQQEDLMKVVFGVVGIELEVRDVRDAGGLETVPELGGVVPGRDALSVVLVVREGVEELGDLAGGMWQVRSVDEGKVVGWQEVGRYGVCNVAGGEQGMDRYGLDGAGR